MKRQEEHLYSRVRAVWRRELSLHVAAGLLAFCRWGIPFFLAGMVVDWLAHLPAPVRFVMLAALLAVSGYKAWRAGWRHVRPFNAAHTALRIEEHLGGMESLLVTAIQFRDSDMPPGASKALRDVTCRRAEEAVAQVRPGETVRYDGLRRPAIAALLIALVIGLLGVVNGPFLAAGVARLFAPWMDVSYPTFTQLELAGDDIIVQEGDPVNIRAGVSRFIPKRAKLDLRTGTGKPRRHALPIENGQCEYEIRAAFRSFEYRLMAGDARSPWQAVQVIASPRIERAEVRLEYPAYTDRPAETVEALTVNVPETTGIHWTLSLDRAVREAVMNLSGQASIPLDISADGLTVTMQLTAAESRAYSFSWVDREHGFSFTSPSHYLQVAPDRPPRVELTSPRGHLYATLGRRLDLAFRGQDDHGICESVIAYRVDKTEEAQVSFSTSAPIDGTEQQIDWDYRVVLTNLVVGQTVAFAVELTDRYPGVHGPHRVRSDSRRMQFMSREDYLAQIEKQKNRLLAQLRTIYREERSVHELVMRLDPSDPVFVQTCQLEAVRQDLMRERLNKLAVIMLDLTEDLAANGITNQPVVATLVQLRSDLETISAQYLGKAADGLRALASASEHVRDSRRQDHAVHMVNRSARELGLLVLQLGFRDAADVMARELHAAAQTQADLRLQTIMPTEASTDLAARQERLAQWLTRLFGASPRERESTVDEALVEFTLSRLVKKLVSGGVDERMQKAAALIGDEKPTEAAQLQAEVIQSLLQAAFRLRVGAEREALAKALELFVAQEDGQKALRVETRVLTPQAFDKRREEIASEQRALHRNLHVLLMPAVPAPRTRLFDDAVPSARPVAGLLTAADAAMTKAASLIEAGDRKAAENSQVQAETSFRELADIVRQRIAAMTQKMRLGRLAYGALEVDERLGRFTERQLSLLEKTEDAAADATKSAYLADQEQGLVDTVEELSVEVADRIRTAATPSENSLALPVRIADALRSMNQAIPLLRDEKPREAAGHEDEALEALAGARALLAEHGENLGAFAALVGSTDTAVAPSPYVSEIIEEQSDMVAMTRAAKPDELPRLAIPQKNLVHAVDAILTALDPLAHLVESGTIMLFAKDDMDAAGTALEDKDPVEALDAQTFVVETLQALRGKLETVIPQFLYIREVAEALHEIMPEGVLIREAQRRLRERTTAEDDAAALSEAQGALHGRADAYGMLINKVAGLGQVGAAAPHMAAAKSRLDDGDRSAAASEMKMAEDALRAETTELLKLMTHFGHVFDPPMPGQEISSEVQLLREVLAVAAQQKVCYRESYIAKPDQTAGFVPKLRQFEEACGPFIERATLHKVPVVEVKRKSRKPEPVIAPAAPVPPANFQRHLVAAKGHIGNAASNANASARDKAMVSQYEAAEHLRHFVVAYTLTFVKPPGPPPPADPADTDEFTEGEDIMQLFMPGAVTGKRPPDGRLEWEVLGRRDRAALNENFARELPLEYRAILKDYYERLAE